jgi:hypothetical protein
MSSNALPKRYVPGKHLKCGRGFTAAEFENLNDVAFAIPFKLSHSDECGPQYYASGAFFTNYYGRDIVLSVARPGGTLDNGELYDEYEIVRSDVYKGQTQFVPFPPLGYTLSLSEFTENADNGKRAELSGAGIPFATIEGQHISLLPGASNGELRYQNYSENTDNHTSISNFTRNKVSAQFVRDANPLATDAQLDSERASRGPDYGGQDIVETIILPGGTEHFLPSPEFYIVRVLETKQTQNGGYNCAQVGRIQTPPKTNYVELSKTNVRPGFAVVALLDQSRSGAINLEVYSQAQIKLVSSDIVQNLR